MNQKGNENLREAETKALLERIKGVYPRVSINEFSVDIWQEVLKNVSYEKSYKALVKYCTEDGTHEPKPGDILRTANTIYEPIQEYEKVECDKCRGTGLVFLVDSENHESVGACICDNGLEHPGLPKIRRYSYGCDGLGRVKI